MAVHLCDWCCFYYFTGNILVALLEALFVCVCVPCWYVHDQRRTRKVRTCKPLNEARSMEDCPKISTARRTRQLFPATSCWLLERCAQLNSSGALFQKCLCHANEGVMSRIWMNRVTHTNESCHTCEWIISQRPRRCHFAKELDQIMALLCASATTFVYIPVSSSCGSDKTLLQCSTAWCNVLHCVAVCCAAAPCKEWQCVAVCCSVVQRIAVFSVAAQASTANT